MKEKLKCFTLEVWVQPTSLEQVSHVLDIGEEEGERLTVGLVSGQLFVVLRGQQLVLSAYREEEAEQGVEAQEPGVALNAWNHVALVYDGEARRLYLWVQCRLQF